LAGFAVCGADAGEGAGFYGGGDTDTGAGRWGNTALFSVINSVLLAPLPLP